MIYQVHINRYNMKKEKLDHEALTIKALGIDELFRLIYVDHKFIQYNLHWLTTAEREFLFKIKIISRHEEGKSNAG